MNAQMMAFEVQQPERQSINLPRRILVVGRVSLLEEGVVRLIRGRHMIIFHADDGCTDDVIEMIGQSNPDVIILCHVEPGMVNSLVSRLDDLPDTSGRILLNVDLRNVELRIYQRHHWNSAAFNVFFPLVYGEIAEIPSELGLSM